MRPQQPATHWRFDSQLDAPTYVRRLLERYRQTPTTVGRIRHEDRRLAVRLYRQHVPLEMVQAAFNLAACRRLFRDPEAPPLAPIRSLHYFLPVLEELRTAPIDPDYFQYLEWKLQDSQAHIDRLQRLIRSQRAAEHTRPLTGR